MKINEVSKLTGVTVRTLQYYDKIGLLAPSEVTDAGYRLYDENALFKLAQIMFFKELDFSLSEIKRIITSPDFDTRKALLNQKELLIKKRDRLNGLIELVDRTLEGGKVMSFKEFDSSEIEKAKEKYAKETKEKYGDTPEYAEFWEKTTKYTKQDWDEVNGKMLDIFKKFADNMDKAPESPEAQALVKEWQYYISENFYTCPDEVLQGLGLMYVNDVRFKNNIDKTKEGLAEYISKAISAYCNK